MIDVDEDGLVTFREFAQELGVICKGELQDRLQFMFRMHLPPVVSEGTTDNSDDESLDSCSEILESSEEVSCQSRHQQNVSKLVTKEEAPLNEMLNLGDGNITQRSDNEEGKVPEIKPMSQVEQPHISLEQNIFTV